MATHPELVRVQDRAIELPDVGVVVDPAGAVREAGGAGAATAHPPGEVRERLAGLPPTGRQLEAVALGVAEDVVVVDGDGRAVWLHVCAPSGWRPGAAGGSPLAALHGPIPDAERLVAASRNLARAITTSGPHVRWVWGLTDDPSLAQAPTSDGPEGPPLPPSELTFRAERQTTLPLTELGWGVFLIRVHRAPLRDVVTTEERRRRLADAVAALPPALATYKGVGGRRRERLLEWLTSVDADGGLGRSG